MAGPGYHCDGCGDYIVHDGKESRSQAQEDLRAEVARLRVLVEKAISLGFGLEAAYQDGQRSRYDVEAWDHEQWDPIQKARDALGAVAQEADSVSPRAKDR